MNSITTNLIFIAFLISFFMGLFVVLYSRSCFINKCNEISEYLAFEGGFSSGLSDWDET